MRGVRIASGSLVAAAIAAAASVTCDALAKAGSVQVEFDRFAIPPAPYAAELDEYWSRGCHDLKPGCVLHPKSAQEVAAVVQVLRTNNESFAVKSGGLSANPTWASVSGGPLISTRRLNEVSYDPATNVARIGTGNRWTDVQKVLDPLGVTVAGARVGEVGVGGYLVGGGFSFLSTQHGWAVNTLVGAEMVLPSGTVVTVSATQHPDLFAAIKGGGNNFGIVTTYLMEAFPIGKVWGGMMVFTGGSDRADAMLAAIANFTATYADHPKAGIIPTVQLVLSGLIELWVVFAFYDGPTPPPGVFDQLLSVGPLINTCKTQSYADLLASNSAIVLRLTRYNVATEMAAAPTSPAVGAQVLRTYYDHWRNVSARYGGVGGLTSSMAIQPVPSILAAEARRRGGDLLDLDASADRFIFEYDLSYLFSWDDKLVAQAAMEMTTGMKKLVDGHAEKGTTPAVFLPLFANDVFREQDYFARLRPEKRALARRVSLEIDPEKLFRTRTGGWKP